MDTRALGRSAYSLGRDRPARKGAVRSGGTGLDDREEVAHEGAFLRAPRAASQLQPTPYTMPGETNLIARAQSGEDTALEELIMRIRPHVERQLTRYPVSDEDRRDLLQMTLLQVVRRLASFRGESNFSTWLFRVTANEALMLMRSQRRHRARLVEGLDLEDLGSLTTLRAATEDTQDARSRTECESVLRDALAELPEDYRHIVVAHYHEDKGLQEIADKLRVSESAVRSRLHRARSRLRAILENSSVASSFAETKAGEAA